MFDQMVQQYTFILKAQTNNFFLQFLLIFSKIVENFY